MTATTTDLEQRPDGFLHRRLHVGEVSLHVAEAPPEAQPDDAPLVVLLHGFPEHWWSWRSQLTALADAGFRAVAPDMRGYNESDKPDGVDAYRVESLATDVAGLVRALGRERAFVVGHDWGGAVAWQFAQQHPEMLDRLAILNVPHPLQMARGLRRPRQLARSWYMFGFQLPRVPERLLALDDYRLVRSFFAREGFPPEHVERYVEAIRAPGALGSMLAYYRSAVRRAARGEGPRVSRIERPVLVLWGDRDRYLGKELAAPPPRFVPDARVVHLPDATHWVQRDEPARVSDLLASFFREGHGGDS